MGGLLGRPHLVAVPEPPAPAELTDREALLLGALLRRELDVYCEQRGLVPDVVDPCALDDIRDRLRQRWVARLDDGGGDEGERLRRLGRGTEGAT